MGNKHMTEYAYNKAENIHNYIRLLTEALTLLRCGEFRVQGVRLTSKVVERAITQGLENAITENKKKFAAISGQEEKDTDEENYI